MAMAEARDDDEERVRLQGLDPVSALKALLAVDPDAPPADEHDDDAPKPKRADNK